MFVNDFLTHALMKTRRIFRMLPLVVSAALLLTCSGKHDTIPEPAPPSAFHGVRVYIVSMGDLHEYSGNLAQYRTLVKSIRDTVPYVYTILAGDFFMLHRSYDVKRCDGQIDKEIPPDLKVPRGSSQLTAGLAMARLTEYLDFDAIAPGNHDWVYGIAMLKRSGLKQKLVGCNIAEPALLTRDFLSFSSESGHYTLNLIGVAGNDDIHPQSGETVKIHSITTSTSLNKIRSAIKTGNMNVLITHLPEKDDDAAFTKICNTRGEPLFDALCGGHTHKSEAKVKSGAVYVKAGLYGTFAGLTCLWWDTVRHEVIKKTSRLVCLGELIPDPETSVLIDSLHRVYPHYP